MHKNIHKVEGGKLIKVFLEIDGYDIEKIKITGDFFVYPENHIELLEEELIGVHLDYNMLYKIIDDFFKRNNTKLFGIDAENLAATILGCLNE